MELLGDDVHVVIESDNRQQMDQKNMCIS